MTRPAFSLSPLFAGVVVAALAGCTTASTTAFRPAYFLSTQDGRVGLDDGKPVVRNSPDSLAIIVLEGNGLRLVHQIDMPTSLVGPPSSIAVAPNSRLALISAATRRDPADASKVIAHDLVSVVALDAGDGAPKVVAQLRTGAGASGISINPAGTLALVANRVEGSISTLVIEADQVRVAGKLMLGDKASPAHVAFTPDGRRALVTRDGDNRISLLAVTGQTVALEPREIFAGLRPYGLDVSSDGAWAAVTNLGAGQGDADTMSLIDLRTQPPRVVDTVTAGQTPEGVFFSPDGKMVGVSVIDGSNKPRSSPFYGAATYRLFGVDAGKLKPHAQLQGGQWLQGHAFAPDGKSILVQDAVSRAVRLYRYDGATVHDSGQSLPFEGAPSTLKFWR
jgi:DNA-binding beta-propeller fold protein YncE